MGETGSVEVEGGRSVFHVPCWHAVQMTHKKYCRPYEYAVEAQKFLKVMTTTHTHTHTHTRITPRVVSWVKEGVEGSSVYLLVQRTRYTITNTSKIV